ncbi:MAG: hypothetical protein ACRD2Z_13820 [Thermoanaerobaculia bacterium]
MSPIAARGSRERDRRAELLPAALLPLVDDAFVRSCDLLEEYVFRLAAGIVRRTGLAEAARRPGTAVELASRAGLQPDRAAAVVPWLFETLALKGRTVRENGPSGEVCYRLPAELPEDPPDEVAALQREHDPASQPAYDLARRAADVYPEFLAGGRRGEELLFAADGQELWLRYFSGDNPLYAINNELGALAVTEWVGNARGVWLELGGGGASGALALLARLEREGSLQALQGYRFTELVPMLLARGSRALRQRFGDKVSLLPGRLDIDRDFASQGVEPSAHRLVYAVNTLHVARDLAFTLAEIYRTLAPGGWLVISEGLRPFAGQPVYTELVFLLLDAYRAPRFDPGVRPVAGFLTPEQWETAFLTAGFEDLRFLPDVRRIREAYPSFVVGAVGARRPD